jgi:hypothetical protein
MSGGKKSLIAWLLGEALREAPTGLSTGSVDDLPHLFTRQSRVHGVCRFGAVSRAKPGGKRRQCLIEAATAKSEFE